MTVSLSRALAALESAGVAAKPPPAAVAEAALEFRGVQSDSRRVRPGDLFVAWAGRASDGHDHVGAARAAGAVAAVVERTVADAGVRQIEVDDARRAAAVLADLAAGSPWRRLRTVAVTGTNGKTTTSLLLRGALNRRAPAAAVGTLGVVDPDGAIRPHAGAALTTPGCVELTAALGEMASAGVDAVVVESSSHALDQGRLDGVRFDVVAYTNLSRDHLDYHGTPERYLAAKARLLERGKEGFSAVLNADDEAWRALPAPESTVRYGFSSEADLRALNVRSSPAGSRFDLVWRGRRAAATLPLPGGFNVANALCATACALVLGRSLDAAAAGLARAAPIPGRLERVASEPFDVYVDFAHTPDALEQALGALRPLVLGRLIVVFGAGGDRDPAKRPEMGAAASRSADVVVVTSDNPRTEDPSAIVAAVAAGVVASKRREIVDRRRAIHWALDAARPGDAVLLAGKGHERTQIVGTRSTPFDEPAIVRERLGAEAAP